MAVSRRSMMRWWLLTAAVLVCTVTAKATAKQDVKRLNNLDYLDAAALRYYLSAPQADYDVAIMFYAQWCTNCHSLAPVWDQISRILKAGTTDSKVIVGLFDCETNLEHEQLCSAAGVKHYPTLAFVSLAGNNHHLARKAPTHVTKYAANWQYGDALLDWIQAMSALAQWHRAGWGKRIRNFIFGKKKKSAPEPLPLGVPKAVADQQELQKLRTLTNETQALAVRSSAFVDVLLFPVTEKDAPLISDNGKNYTDVYALLQKKNAWKSDFIFDQIVRTCASEIALDYCSRLSTQYMEVWIENWPLNQQITEEAFNTFQTHLHQDLVVNEPFCALMDDCAAVNFAEKKCQPETCPFTDPTVCRYLTGCLTDQLQHEYAEAMQLLPHQQQQKQSQKGSGFSWGL
jgi:thiol-disulfide isomerase/thioredoxin